MKKMRLKRVCFIASILVVLAIGLTGCIGSASKPSTFYMLNSMPEAGSSHRNGGDQASVSVLIGPITLPAYLSRTQMVTMAGNNEVVLDEFNRWAEPLKDNFYRVLMENLSSLLNTSHIYAYDRDGSTTANYQVVIDVTNFHGTPGGDVCLTAFWRIVHGEDGKTLRMYKSVFRAPVSGEGFPEIVDAQNQTLTVFSREIASAIQALRR
jgi:uncharacterized protein